MNWRSAVFFVVCINFGLWIVAMASAPPSSGGAGLYPVTYAVFSLTPETFARQMGGGNVSNPGALTITSILSTIPNNLLSVTGLTLTGLGIVGAVFGLITQNYVFAFIVMLLWVLTMIVPLLQWVFGALPGLLAGLGVPWYIQFALDALYFSVMFLGIMEIAAQRPLG
jgi:hypothetical protein